MVLTRGILTSLVSRGLAAIAPLITIPIALQHLGATAYGAWMAAISLTALSAFADLGLGVGLMTRLAGVLATDKVDEARALVTSAYVCLAGISAILAAGIWISSIWVDWAGLVGGSGADVSGIVMVTLTIFVLNIVATLIVRIQYACEQVSLSNMWQAAGSISGMLGVVLAARLEAIPVGFVLIASGLPLVISVANALWFFLRGRGRNIAPARGSFRLDRALELTRLGFRFALITVLLSVTMSTDSAIIANAASLEVVPSYSIPARVFGVLTVVVSALTIPLWPANAAALHSGEVAWVTRTTGRMICISGLLVAALSGILVFSARSAIDIWLGGAIDPSPVLLWGLALTSIAQAVAAPLFMVQNAAEVTTPQIVGYSFLVLSLPVKWIVVADFGYEFTPWVTLCGYCLLIWPAAIRGYVVSLRRFSEPEVSS